MYGVIVPYGEVTTVRDLDGEFGKCSLLALFGAPSLSAATR